MFLHPSVESFAHLLHMCRLERNRACALHLHACMCNWGLDSSPWLGNNLVSVLAEAGSVGIAWNVFLRLTHRTICSWNSLMTGFIKLGDSHHALYLYNRLQDDSLHPNEHTYVALLKACTELKAMDQGCMIHEEILMNSSLANNLYINTTLVHMYATCGSLTRAEMVFEKLPSKSVVSWNALIAGYIKQELAMQALYHFNQMHEAGISPNAVTFVCILKAYGCIKAVEKGREIHAEIARNSLLESNLIIQGALVDMYAKCGSVITAQEVFDKLPTRCLVTWTALISGYIKYEYGREALNCFEQMRLEGVFPNSITFSCSLKACGMIGALDKGNEIYTEVLQQGLLRSDVVVGNALIDMYMKCGLLARAEEVFDELPFRDVVSWNALMAGYVNFELYEAALELFDQMIQEDHCPDAVTYIFALKSCGIIGATDRAIEIHSEVARQGALEREVEVGNALVDTYVKCGFLVAAQEVFDRMLLRDVVSWTALISGYAEKNFGSGALKHYRQMQSEGVYPNAITFVCVLKVCGSTKDKHMGELIHAQMVGNELLERDPLVSSALIHMYVNCGSLSKAKELFDKSPMPNEALWNTMLAGYANHEHCEEALQFFDIMTLHGLSPDKITYLSCLKACGHVGAEDLGRGLHADVAMNGLLETDSAIGNAVVHMYAKCGLLVKAQAVLDKLPVKDIVSWTAIIEGYVKHGNGRGALKCFEQMQTEGVLPNAVTYIFGLKACTSVGATEKGQEIYSEIARQGLLESNCKLSTSLIDMYAKCGQLAKAQEVFDTGASQSVVLWNTLIAGFAKLDQVTKALICFEEMQVKGFFPDTVTFLNLLGACNQAGLVSKGYSFFRAMSKGHGISPNQEHHQCMADLLARTGSLEEANEFIRKTHCLKPVARRSMLSASQYLGTIDLAKAIFECAAGFGEEDAVIYYNSVDNTVVQKESSKAWEMSTDYPYACLTGHEIFRMFPVVNNKFCHRNSYE